MNMITGLPSSKHSDSVYDIFFEKIVCHYEALKEIVSDRGLIFTSSY